MRNIQPYPNNGFKSYWKYLSSTAVFNYKPWLSKLLTWLHTGFKLSGQVLKDAGIELLFLLAFWLIITKMSQGRDLIVSLFEPDGIYGTGRIFFTTLSVISFSVSMWIIPAFLFQQRDRRNNRNDRYNSIFKKHLFFVHRILPLIPFWIVAYVLFNGDYIAILFTVISLLQLMALYFFNEKVKKTSQRNWWALIVLLLLIASIIYFATIYKETYTRAKITLTVILYLISFLMYFIYHEVDRRLLDEHVKPDNLKIRSFNKYKINSWFYITCLILHIIIIALIFSAPRIFNIAPESMMLYIFSLNVFLIDLFVYFINVSTGRKLVATIGIIVIFLLYYFSPSLNLNVKHYTLDNISDSSILKGYERITFEDRFNDLKKRIELNNSNEPYPVILISGEGGGSRAGMWFSQNLINFDYYTRGKFRNHIFSISTVSGSSVGLSTLFAFWEQQQQQDSIDQTWLELPSKIYANNFVGSSISGLLLTDFWKSLLPGDWEKDRNSTLQDEEAYYTQKACLEILKKEDLKRTESIPRDQWLLAKDFMYFFYKTENGKVVFRNERPLVFINTCRSNDGRRGIFSPVKLSNDAFNDAIDIAGYLYEDSVSDYAGSRLGTSIKRNISLGQACNASELFPILSAPAYIDSLGSFVDGGYHENSGLKTTLDVYQKLKTFLDNGSSLNGRYKIYIIYLKNGSGEKNLYKPLPSEMPFTLPLKALSSQPFQGSASYFEEKAKYTANDPRTTYITVQLDNKIIKDQSEKTATKIDRDIELQILDDLRTEANDSLLNFPLARWLSKSVINRMRLAVFPLKEPKNKDDLAMRDLLNTINTIDTAKPVSLDPFRKLSPNADNIFNQLDLKKQP